MRRTADPIVLEQQRFNAARMHDLGLEPVLIAKSLGFDDQTVRRWIREYDRGGLDALKARLYPGPRPRLSEDQKQQLLQLLQQPPSAYAAEGLAGQLWTSARIAHLIKSHFGVSYHPSHVGQMMHELDYSQQLPAKKPMPRDQAKIELWRDERWPAIVQRARATDAVIVFVDEAAYLLEPLRKKVWAPRGQTPVLVHQAGVNPRKVSVIGGLAFPGSSSCSLEQPRLFTQWHAIAITVNDGPNPIPIAFVRVDSGVSLEMQQTNNSGVAQGYSLNNGTYTVSTTTAGYIFSPVTLTVSGAAQSLTYSMTPAPISIPIEPDEATAHVLMPDEGLTISYQLTTAPIGSGIAYDRRVKTSPESEPGTNLIQFAVKRGAEYLFWYGNGRKVPGKVDDDATEYAIPNLTSDDALTR